MNPQNTPNEENSYSANLMDHLIKKMKEAIVVNYNKYQNESAAYGSFEKYSNLNRKTLKSLMNETRVPYPNTIIAIYRWIFKETDTNKLESLLDPEIKVLLSSVGYPIETQKQNVNDVIFRSNIHTAIYFMTSDQQILSKDTIFNLYGQTGLFALTELVANKIIADMGNDHYTTGEVRAEQNTAFFEGSSMGITSLFPFAKLEKDYSYEGAVISCGNVTIAKEDEKAFMDHIRAINKILNKYESCALKLAKNKKSNIMFSFSAFRAPDQDITEENEKDN